MISIAMAREMLDVAVGEAELGLSLGGIPIGAALFSSGGTELGRGHNRRVQDNNPAIHGETAAFINAGRQSDYRDLVMVTTLAPCLYCTGLIRQFNIGTVVVGESTTFSGGLSELRDHGVQIIELEDQRCVNMMTDFITTQPALWNEDIGVAE